MRIRMVFRAARLADRLLKHIKSRMHTRRLLSIALVGATLLLVYWHTITNLVLAWSTDDNYSHGFLIVPIALWLTWERRRELAAAPRDPSWLGLALFIFSLFVLVIGSIAAELFTTRVSIIGAIAGLVLFFYGRQHFRILRFPLLFLFLMVPLTAIIFNQIAFPLQILASRVGQTVLTTVGIPVLREGNLLILANTTLQVAEACSGIRSLISLLTLGIIVGYLADRRASVQWIIALSSVPVAILTNGIRVAGTGIAAHYMGSAAAEGFFHEFSGWLVFVTAFAMMLALQRLISRLVPMPIAQQPVPTAA